jgi:methylmalonyl-CoA/ethylmalonyl-CoA epimerase
MLQIRGRGKTSITERNVLSTSAVPSLGEQVHHYGYVVENLERAMDDFITNLGAGPFFVIENVPLEGVQSRGEPAVFAHSSGFAVCGGTPVELMQIHDASPAQVSAGFSQSRPHVHHVAWAVPALEATIDQLDRNGYPSWLRAELGDIRFSYHDASSTLGHHIELHHDGDALRGFFGMIQEASEGWDGSDPVRTPEF